jgi:hypothetical protein
MLNSLEFSSKTCAIRGSLSGAKQNYNSVGHNVPNVPDYLSATIIDYCPKYENTSFLRAVGTYPSGSMVSHFEIL